MESKKSPEPFRLKDAQEQIVKIWETLKTNFDKIYNALSKLTEKVESNDDIIRQEMRIGGSSVKKSVIDLQRKVSQVEATVSSLKDDNNELKDKIYEMQKQINFLLSGRVKNETAKHRELHGGQIDVIQHQDLLSSFKDLSQSVIALSREVLSKKNSLLERSTIRGTIAKIFTQEISYDEWLNEIFTIDNIPENTINLKEKKYINEHFMKFYDEVSILKKNMQMVKSESNFYLPSVGISYDNLYHVLVSEKCDERKPISVVVSPGILRGERLDEKAIVYTDLY